jgi:hypothetical protein
MVTARRLGTVALIASAMTLASGAARAADADPATAEALFAAGRTLLEQGDYEAACAKLGESQRLDPAAGTLMNLADCNERRGRLASAWENWRDALGMLRTEDERRAIVERRLTALETRLPRLVIALAAGAPQETTVTRDEQALGPAALGVPLPVDPGLHRVTVRASGFGERTYTVSTEEGRAVSLLVEPGPRLPAPSPAPTPVATAPAVPAPAPEAAHGSFGRTLGLVLGGAGAAALVTGGVTGILALEHKSDIVDHCTKAGAKYLCDAEHVEAARSGKTLAVTSSILLPAGLALVGVGAALFLTAHDAGPSVSATLGPGGLALAARGAF